jgi:hypothetical protein
MKQHCSHLCLALLSQHCGHSLCCVTHLYCWINSWLWWRHDAEVWQACVDDTSANGQAHAAPRYGRGPGQHLVVDLHVTAQHSTAQHDVRHDSKKICKSPAHCSCVHGLLLSCSMLCSQWQRSRTTGAHSTPSCCQLPAPARGPLLPKACLAAWLMMRQSRCCIAPVARNKACSQTLQCTL